VGFRGYAPFLAAAIVMAAGSVPLLLLQGDAGAVVIGGEKRLWATARLVPLLLVIALIAGIFETVAWGVFQVYALNSGFPVRTVGWMLASFFAGQIVLTYPIGWVGDRVDRGVLLMWTGWISVALMLAMYLWGRTYAIWVIVFMTGGVFCAVYALGLAVLGQRFESKSLASAGASFMTAYGIGAVAGAPLVGALMDRFGPGALPLILAAASAAVALCALAARSEWSPSARALTESGPTTF
jgi:MFS family permease